MVTEKLAHTNSTGVKQLLFKIDTVGSGELSVGIAQPFSSHRGHWNNLTIKPTIVHYNQAIVWWHSDWYFFIRIFKSGIDVQSRWFGNNIYNLTGVDPQGTIGTISPDLNSARRLSITLMSYFINWNASSRDAGRSEDHVGSDIFKNAGSEKRFEIEKVKRENSNSIHFTYSDSNRYGSNQVDLNHDG